MSRLNNPPFGLLLDVDGPIASPVTRTIAIDEIAQILVQLSYAGIPIAFVTGRSDHFIREVVLSKLVQFEIEEALSINPKVMFGVFEKGACWATVTSSGMSTIEIDQSVAPREDFIAGSREIVESEYADLVFFDETKHAMISIEQHPYVEASVYAAGRDAVDQAIFDLAKSLGIGIRLGEQKAPDAAGLTPFRIDQTIISSDIESIELDKDRGARRALEYFRSNGITPSKWYSVGDSRSDYKMADEVHKQGLPVAHVDVRPADGILSTPYEVISYDSLIHDEAGVVFLRERLIEL